MAPGTTWPRCRSGWKAGEAVSQGGEIGGVALISVP